MTKELIQQLRELEANATPGVYTFHVCARCGDYQTELMADDKSIVSAHHVGEDDYGAMEKKDAEFICALRNNAKALLDEIERLQAELELIKNNGYPYLMIAGEPYDYHSTFMAAGEDMVNNRLLVTLVDWSKAVNDGWRTKLDLKDEELNGVADAIHAYLINK